MTIPSPMKPVDISARPFGYWPEIVLALPRSPSTNGLFFNSSGGGRSMTAGYRAWTKEAGWCVRIARPKPIKGRVSVQILVEDIGKSDLDNHCKAVCDLLVKHALIENDSREILRKVEMEWSSEIEGCRVTVRSCV